jgi:hypothetical protein
MNRISPALLLGLAAASFVACADDGVGRIAPRLTVVPVGGNGATADVESLTIDLGQVPIYSTAIAVFDLKNDSGQRLEIESVEYTQQVGEKWLEPEYSATVQRFSKGTLKVGYSPIVEGRQDLAKLLIKSNAADNPAVEVTVKGTGVYVGAPDIQVEYPGYAGPDSGDCVMNGTSVVGCAIPPSSALNMGNVGLGAMGSARIKLRNMASCAPYPGTDPCTACSLRIAKGTFDIGLGFKPGTNNDNRFAFVGSTATPFDLWQRNVECGAAGDGEVTVQINFTAPMTEGDFSTVIVVESNDPDEPAIEIPVIAKARNAPTAVCKFRAFDPANPTEYTDPSHIEPLTRVYFDGTDSFDPANPTDNSLITGYMWDVTEYPDGTNTADFQWQSRTGPRSSFWLPLAGHYVVSLMVENSSGIQSAPSYCEFDVVPGSRLHIQLTWDDPTNDQDLHLTNGTAASSICDSVNDCYFSTCNPTDTPPVWFASGPSGAGPNPTLDIDDTDGLGPENINIDNPSAGTFRVYVHNWRQGTGTSTRNTVRIYLDGAPAAEYRRTLSQYDLWAVADIVWDASGGNVVVVPSDVSGQVGRITNLPTSSCFDN